jgi:hypothetical protein
MSMGNGQEVEHIGYDVLENPPNPMYIKGVAAIIRSLLQAAAGLGFGWASFVSGSQIEMLASTGVFVVSTVWSLFEKYKTRKKMRQAVVESAIRSANASVTYGIPTPIATISPPPAPPTPSTIP